MSRSRSSTICTLPLNLLRFLLASSAVSVRCSAMTSFRVFACMRSEGRPKAGAGMRMAAPAVRQHTAALHATKF